MIPCPIRKTTVLLLMLVLFAGLACSRRKTIKEENQPILPLENRKKPIDANANWKIIIGKYQKMEGNNEEFFSIRENELELTLLIKEKEYKLEQVNYKEYICKQANPYNFQELHFVIDKKGFAALCKVKDAYWERVTYGEVMVDFANIEKPTQTIKKDLPTLVSVKELDPTLKIELKLLRSQTAFLNKEPALALKKANQSLSAIGYELILVDAYRPKSVSLPNEGDNTFDTGNTVSVLLFNTKSLQLADTGSLYLETSERSAVTYTGGTSLERWQREVLRSAMTLQGFIGDDSRWWQFTWKGVH